MSDAAPEKFENCSGAFAGPSLLELIFWEGNGNAKKMLAVVCHFSIQNIVMSKESGGKQVS